MCFTEIYSGTIVIVVEGDIIFCDSKELLELLFSSKVISVIANEQLGAINKNS